MYEGVLQDLIDELARLPGVGPKGEQRIAFHLLAADPVDVRRSKALGILARPDRALALLARHQHQPDQPEPEDDDRPAGTTTTPPASSTVVASGPSSAALSITCSPSRSHCTAAPVTKMAPSSA